MSPCAEDRIANRQSYAAPCTGDDGHLLGKVICDHQRVPFYAVGAYPRLDRNRASADCGVDGIARRIGQAHGGDCLVAVPCGAVHDKDLSLIHI